MIYIYISAAAQELVDAEEGKEELARDKEIAYTLERRTWPPHSNVYDNPTRDSLSLSLVRGSSGSSGPFRVRLSLSRTCLPGETLDPLRLTEMGSAQNSQSDLLAHAKELGRGAICVQQIFVWVLMQNSQVSSFLRVSSFWSRWSVSGERPRRTRRKELSVVTFTSLLSKAADDGVYTDSATGEQLAELAAVLEDEATQCVTRVRIARASRYIADAQKTLFEKVNARASLFWSRASLGRERFAKKETRVFFFKLGFRSGPGVNWSP